MMPYTIALIFERRSHYWSLGFSEDECEELHDDEEIDGLVLSLRSLDYTIHVVGDIKDLVACLARENHRSIVAGTSSSPYQKAYTALPGKHRFLPY